MQELRDLIERMQAELKFKQTRIEALNFEVARLKRWRFGMASPRSIWTISKGLGRARLRPVIDSLANHSWSTTGSMPMSIALVRCQDVLFGSRS